MTERTSKSDSSAPRRLGQLINEETPDAPTSVDEAQKRLAALSQHADSGNALPPLATDAKAKNEGESKETGYAPEQRGTAIREAYQRKPLDLEGVDDGDDDSSLDEIADTKGMMERAMAALADAQIKLTSSTADITLEANGYGDILELKVNLKDCSSTRVRTVEQQLVLIINEARKRALEIQSEVMGLDDKRHG